MYAYTGFNNIVLTTYHFQRTWRFWRFCALDVWSYHGNWSDIIYTYYLQAWFGFFYVHCWLFANKEVQWWSALGRIKRLPFPLPIYHWSYKYIYIFRNCGRGCDNGSIDIEGMIRLGDSSKADHSECQKQPGKPITLYSLAGNRLIDWCLINSKYH